MVVFNGLDSVRDRTIFSNKGPISKKPLPILTGNGLKILSENSVEIPTGVFTPAQVGFLLEISGSNDGRNDGIFPIEKVVSSTILRLSDSCLNVVDDSQTLSNLLTVANAIKKSYNFHLSQVIESGPDLVGVHGSNDFSNSVIASDATDLPSLILLINEIKTKYELHRINQSGTPHVHPNIDSDDVIYAKSASDINNAIILLNDIKKNYEDHRQSKFYHVVADTVNSVLVPFIRPVKNIFPGPLTGPFTWTLLDPQYGQASNDPYDVAVRINGSPAVVEAVIGQLGAIVLEQKPSHGDDVKIDYSIIKCPPQKFLRLNSPEFNLNQYGANAVSGWTGHSYESTSYIIDPTSPNPDFMSPLTPKRVGWKYKAIERAYSAVLNDPTSLLLNVPTNKIAFTAFEEIESEINIFYDPIVLPQDSASPWTRHGQGQLSLNSDEQFLDIVDDQTVTGQLIDPPFFSQKLTIDSPSYINSAFRTRINSTNLVFDGVSTGVGLGISDGLHLIQIGFIQSDPSNLSSAVFMANDLRSAFNAHIISDGVHDPNDSSSNINLAPAVDLDSLVLLINNIKSNYNSHISKGPLHIHLQSDGFNSVINVDAFDLATSISLIIQLRIAFNAHRIQPNIHFLDDINNEVELVRQVGILTKSGPEEFAENWNSISIDWRQFITYRIFRNPDGSCSLFLSGNVDPVIQMNAIDLPNISDKDLDLDDLQSVFFGSLSRSAASDSQWQFIRLVQSPVESLFIENNKSVEYDASVLPQLDTSNPWIDLGTSGSERILSGDVLLLDSIGGATLNEVSLLGLSTGAFRGFLRLEPAQNSDTTTSLEFRVSCDFFTHSIDNQSIGVMLDDGQFSTQIAFLQFTPTPASIIGIISEPFTIIGGDTLIIKIGSGLAKTVTFSGTDTNAINVANKINSAFGQNLATSVDGRVKIQSIDVGSSASFEILSGSALSKIGIGSGKYSGSDSSPEPRISWFGDDFPNLNNPAWIIGGDQSASLFDDTLRIKDISTSDFLVYSQNNPVITNQTISPNSDWKLNFQFKMLSFIPGDQLPAPLPFQSLDFAGLLINIDEGSSGKNLEIHLSVDGLDTYINLVSYDSATGNLVVISQYAFNWNDGESHSISAFKNKIANQIQIVGDDINLVPIIGPTAAYSILKSGTDSGPSITFGSGSTGALNVDLSSARSVCDWNSVSIFKDSKLSDPNSSSRRFVGLYTGGSSSDKDSYLLYQIDWMLPHTYRLIRDPLSAVSLYVDGNNIPVITTSYDSLSLPSINLSYLNKSTAGRSVVAFGSFNSTEISRTRWEFVNYSIGKLTNSELIVPHHNLLNQHNVITSGEHLRTNLKHTHHGFTVYSGGTPQDDFLADGGLVAYTELNEGTPPIPMTQDLDSRGGLIKTATLINNIPNQDLVDFNGDISNFDNDIVNLVGNFSIVDLANELKLKYNSHILSIDYHNIPDNLNAVVVNNAFDISSSILLLNNIKFKYNQHRVQAGVHLTNDTTNIVSMSDATDLETAITLANDILSKFDDHKINISFHITFDVDNVVEMDSISDSLNSVIGLANDIREKYLNHTSQVDVHLENDYVNVDLGAEAVDLLTAVQLANSEKETFNNHLAAITRETQKIHVTNDSINTVVSPDASDLESVTNLLIEIKIKYEQHRMQQNVHGASVLITIQSPSGVLYDNIKFWKTEDGDSVPLSPYCDELSIDSDSFSSFSDFRIFTLPGTELPEDYTLQQTIRLANDIKSKYNSHLSAVGIHVNNDTVNQVASPNSTDLISLLILLNEIKSDFNHHLIQPNVHIFNDDSNSSIAFNAVDLGTAQALSNDLRSRFENHRIDSTIHLVGDFANAITVDPTVSPTNPGWELLTNGSSPAISSTGTSIKFGVPSLSESVYLHEGIIPNSSSVDFEFSIRMKINSIGAPTGPDYDTRIYAGFISEMDPGIAAGIGFDFIGGKPSVKIQDLNSDSALSRIINDWTVPGFKTYKIIRDSATDTFRLVIE